MADYIGIKTAEQLKAVITGGKGQLIVQNPNTKESHMLIFEKPEQTEENKVTPIFVRYAPEKTKKKTLYVGMINDKGEFLMTKASRFDWDDLPVRTARFVMKLFNENIDVNSCGMNLFQTLRCPVCGRRLTNPESIERGIGPKCAQHIGL